MFRTAAALAAVLSLLEVSAAAQGGPVRVRAPGQDAPVPEPPPRPAPGERPSVVRAPGAEQEADDMTTDLAALPDLDALEGVFAPYTVTDGREIAQSLTGEPGDPAEGRSLFYNAARTGCSLCHGSPELPREEGDESTAPDLYRVGLRLTPGHMRLWIVAPETIKPGAQMPPFHKPGQRSDPSDPLFGGPRLTAEEVEDVVAYLAATTGARNPVRSE